MHLSHSVRTCGLAIMSLGLMLCSTAQALQIRDAATGENATGGQPGAFLVGTGSWLLGSTDNAGLRNIPLGALDLDIDTGSGWQSLIAYCYEPNTAYGFGINPPDTTGLPYSVATLGTEPGISPAEATQLEVLWSNAFALSLTSQAQAAAFQFYVWELVMDDVFDFGSGLSTIDTNNPFGQTVSAIAQQWHIYITLGTWNTQTPLYVLVNPNSQNILTPVPEPAGLLLMLGVPLLRRARR